MAWVRWRHAADGPGPDYCKACRRQRGSDEKCDDCAEPNLLPDAEQALNLYLLAATQWRVGMAGATGLDYGGAEIAWRLHGTLPDPEQFALVQVCERAALQAMTDRQKREAPNHGRR